MGAGGEGDGDGGARKGAVDDRIRIISMTLQDGEELIIGKRLRAVLDGARKRAL